MRTYTASKPVITPSPAPPVMSGGPAPVPALGTAILDHSNAHPYAPYRPPRLARSGLAA
ncbi:hypothetical protein NEUTE2DRAFT_54635 [Neurospora tetrasperma FGSC 2509]|nr:hypothetical protein NEUTE2DRAFT_54635 [Neurospora tetrasperma FGSC 2509]